jgi:hypothetical protein
VSEHKRRLSGAKSTGVVIALGLSGLIGALGAMPAIAAETEGPIQTAEVTPEATPEATPEVTPEATPETTPETTPEPTPEPSAPDDALIEVVPAMPAITWPRCEGDKYIPPTLSAPPNSEGIEYLFEGYWYTNPFLVPIDLEVSASLKEGYTWAAEMPDGWLLFAEYPDSAVYEVKFEDVPCAPHNDPVVPELPVVTQAECVDGELTEPTITLPEDGDGITYQLADRFSDPESTLDVSATLSWSYFWAKEEKFPEGWTWSDVDRAWYDVKLDEVSCEPGAGQPGPSGAEPEQLAATGPSDAAVLGGAALLTVAAGVSLIIVRRRVMGR